jgi:CheY-like chemotaxis protein
VDEYTTLHSYTI